MSTSGMKINIDIKNALKSDGGTLPDGLSVCVKQLSGRGVHTWHGMLGYC
jgi:hypothetical protein